MPTPRAYAWPGPPPGEDGPRAVTQSYRQEPFGVIKDFFLNPGLVQAVIPVSASAAGGDRMDSGLVDVATGDVLLVHRDVMRPGALPLVVGRVYRSSWRAGPGGGRASASPLHPRQPVPPEP